MKHYLGPYKLGEAPLIAGVLSDDDVFSLDQDSVRPADLIELRIDMFQDLDHGHVARVFSAAREKFGKPILATARHVREGGQRDIPDREGMYRAVAPLAEAVDVEIMSGETLRSVKGFLEDTPVLLIGSYHDFDATPDDRSLDRIFTMGKELGADVVKVAATARSRDDLLRLLLFAMRHREEGVIALSMGDLGLPSRVLGPLFGSVVTYGYINRPSAPGQLSVKELSDLMDRLQVR